MRYQFHVSDDLRFPSGPPGSGGTESVKSFNGMTASGVKDSGCAIRTRKLLSHVFRRIGSTDNIQQDLKSCISAWLMINACAAFEASAESTIRSWHCIKSHINDSHDRYINKKRLCEKLRQLTEIKRHLMDKVTSDLHINVPGYGLPHAFGAGDIFGMDYALQQWQRSRASVQWILDDIGHIFKSNESDLQIDLMMTQIEESRKAIQQAEVVKRLTALAFVFIPVSTVCSAFGMNIQQLSQGLPSVWVFVTVALAVATSTVICSTELANNVFWATLSLVDAFGAAWRTWWQDVYDHSFVEQTSLGLGVASIGANLAGVKPWQTPVRGEPLRTKTLQKLPLRAVAFSALLPFRLLGTVSRGIQRVEHRGRAFRARRPP